MVILIHEWWGLNDNIKTMAEDIRVRGCHAIAINLFDRSVANNRDEAKTQTKAVKASKANSTFATSVDRVKATGNGNGVRTRDSELGKPVLCQLSYTRYRTAPKGFAMGDSKSKNSVCRFGKAHYQLSRSVSPG